jgi:predicted short-subunit dehydrogenase-like oxidoreductase (DUF2520 family)
VDARAAGIAIVGPGRLGTSLALAFRQVGYTVVAVGGRERSATARLAVRVDAAVTGVEGPFEADIVFLTVPDRAIAGVAAAGAWRAGQLVAHCSGALGLDVLGAVASSGAMRGCLHPLQTFADPAGDPSLFRGIAAGVEGDGRGAAILAQAASDLGARPFSLAGVDRAAYHAAAVFASNDVIALMAAAARAWVLAGLPPGTARESLAPLLLAAARNVAAYDLPAALTGPIVRGDAATVARHLGALAADPALRDLYAALARELLRLPLPLGAEEREALDALVQKAP